ncbi:hypothetical protein [Dysgonomonas macrotermitis]|uniref:Uncharacterized protein n=1 Tax=Dysgonomonas macrotermitis TaxID=1346286 RepID=A0A1M5IMC1_9BACT|nr:hypothetical protein [Dysgonomonas macrotermitis]SHG29504.1 hypothetical protein SAMN05444362_12041 [Dysgonomonas macrotermitis]
MKFALTIITFLLNVALYGQVGINTKNPVSGTLYIDSRGDNTAGTTDDVFINTNGDVSIGHISPITRLDIKSSLGQEAFRVDDGSEESGSSGEDKMLLSDQNGVARWDTYPGTIPLIYGQLNGGLRDLPFSYLTTMTSSPPTFIYANGWITLPKGRWLVAITMKLSVNSISPDGDKRAWIRAGFISDKPQYTDGTIETINYSTGSVVSGSYVSGFGHSASYGIMEGYSIILNTEDKDITYYFGLRPVSNINLETSDILTKFAYPSTDSHENQIIAIKMADN